MKTIKYKMLQKYHIWNRITVSLNSEIHAIIVFIWVISGWVEFEWQKRYQFGSFIVGIKKVRDSRNGNKYKFERNI